MPESGIDKINEESIPDKTDALSSHLLGGKKHHDENKNVETEEIQHLEKGTDYLTTLLLQQGVKETKTKSKKIPPKLDELKKMFVQNLLKAGYVTVDDKDKTILLMMVKSFLTTKQRMLRLKLN